MATRRLRWAIASGTLILVTGCVGSPAQEDISPADRAVQVTAPLAAGPTNGDPAVNTLTGTAPIAAVALPAEAGVTIVSAPPVADWQLNGSATVDGGELLLTDAQTNDQVGTAFWPTVSVGAVALSASFDLNIGDGSGADGLTLAVLDADLAGPTSVGAHGGSLGWAGLPGFAVAIDTFQNGSDPSYSTVGLVTGFDPAEPDRLQWAGFTSLLPRLRGHTRHVEVVVIDGQLTVRLDGVRAVVAPVLLPHRMLVGFTAANGGRTDRHAVSGVAITIS